MVARQFSLNFLTSQEGNFIKTNFCKSSFQAIAAVVQADFISFHLVKGVISKQNTLIPSGISFNCFLFQDCIDATSQFITTSQTLIFFQANTYLFSQSAYEIKAILALL